MDSGTRPPYGADARVPGFARDVCRIESHESELVANSEQRGLPSRGRNSEMLVGQLRRDAAARGAVQEADLHKKRFVDFFDRVGFFSEDGGKRVHADRAALIFLNDGEEEPAVNFVKALLVDFEHFQGGFGGRLIDFASAADLCVVTDPSQQTVRDSGSAPGTASDLPGAGIVNGYGENFCGTLDDNLQVFWSVELEAQNDAEPGAERSGD